MSATLHMELCATSVRVTLLPNAPSRTQRWLHAWTAHRKHKSGSDRVNGTPAHPVQMPLIEETVAFAPGRATDDPAAAIVQAATQALEAVRARSTAALDGSRVRVRAGMAWAQLHVVPLGFPANTRLPDRQVQSIGQAVANEALGSPAYAHLVRCQIQEDGQHLCVVSLASSLVAGIQALCSSRNLKLISCQPAITEQLASQLLGSARRGDARTMVWTEQDGTSERAQMVNFVRIVSGSAVYAWRTLVPHSTTESAPVLHATVDRFLAAAGAPQDEHLVRCTWPGNAPDQLIATGELHP